KVGNSDEPSLDELLQGAAILISKAFDYKVDICLIEKDFLVFKATVNYLPMLQPDREIFSLNKEKPEGITVFVANTGTSHIAPDVKHDEHYIGSNMQTQSELAVPICIGEERIGVLNVESKELGAFSWEDCSIFEAIAAGISHAIENKQHRRKL